MSYEEVSFHPQLLYNTGSGFFAIISKSFLLKITYSGKSAKSNKWMGGEKEGEDRVIEVMISTEKITNKICSDRTRGVVEAFPKLCLRY